MQSSPRWHLDKENLITAFWVLFHTTVGVVITTALQLVLNFNFGQYTPVVAIVISSISGLSQQYLSGPSCTVPAHQVFDQSTAKTISNPNATIATSPVAQ